MQLMVKAEGIFLGVSKTDYVSKSTGKPGCYYNVAIKQGGEVGSVPCEKALFDRYKAGELKDYTEADFDASFNDRYSRLQVVAVHPKK